MKRTLPKSFIYNEEIIINKTVIANMFNTFFTNIGPNLSKQISNPINKTFRYYLNEQYSNSLTFECIDEETISKTIYNMQPKTSCGYDGISSRLNKPI